MCCVLLCLVIAITLHANPRSEISASIPLNVIVEELKQKGQVEAAIAVMRKAEDEAQAEAEPSRRFKLQNAIGISYEVLEMPSKAEHAYLKALQIWDEHPEIQNGRTGLVLSNLGMLYANHGQVDKTKSILDRILVTDALANVPNETAICFALTNVAHMMETLKQFKQAESLYLLVLPQWERDPVRHIEQILFIENNLGTIYIQQQRWKDALPHCRRAVDLARPLHSPGYYQRQVVSMINLAGVYLQLSEPLAAKMLLDEAERIISKSAPGAMPILASLYASYANFYQQTGQRKDAKRMMAIAREHQRSAMASNVFKNSVDILSLKSRK